MVAAPNYVKMRHLLLRLTNKIIGYCKKLCHKSMSVELLNLACYRMQTISNEGDMVREK